MKKPSTKEVRTWLLWVMARLPGAESEQEVEAKVQMMAGGLANSYPLAAFTEQSAGFVLIDLQWFREADIRQRLDRWRKTYLPDVSMLPEEAEKAPLDRDGKNWIAHWLKVQSDQDANAALGLIRAQHVGAFGFLLQTDVRAASIAIKRGWPDPKRYDRASLESEWGDPDVVEAAIQSCLGHHLDGNDTHPTPDKIEAALTTLRWLVEKFAPQNLAMVPDSAAALTGDNNHGNDSGWLGQNPQG